MPSSSQTLTTVIAINAKVGNGFSEVGATLTELGTMVNGVSRQLIDFGKESVDVYREYEKSMKDAEVALSTTYGRNTRELSGVMNNLDAYATQWAAESIFHTNDVANAISEAAHAGWDFDQIISGVPAAMELARAGSMDLSQAVNYIVKSSNALGLGLEGDTDAMGDFIDLWTFAANSSASTVEEFGDAMLRMGSTMRFAADPAELMTLIAVTANAGQVGTEAGTLIRNSMMRLVAPTEKATDAMALLGATDEDLAELSGDTEALAKANELLAKNGFSAYDESGNLKDILDIYRELYVATRGMTEEEQNTILGAIFPTRTITEALTLLRGAAEEYGGLYEQLTNGDAAGYGQYASETMMDTLDADIEIFLSKAERLKQIVGGELADDVSSFLGGMGEFIDGVAGMDEGKFSALVSGLEVVAAAGPALLAAGGAFRLLGFLMSPTGAIGMGVVGAVALAEALKELEAADVASAFGTGELDGAEIQSFLEGIAADFNAAYAEVDKFSTALETAVTNYQTASTTFTSDLLTDLTTGATLSEADISKYESLGTDMFNALKAGIEAQAQEGMAFWEMVFGSDATPDNADFVSIIGTTNTAYEQALAQAESIGQGLRDAMNAAFKDGKISGDEYQNILSYIQDYNRAMAEAAAEAQKEQDFVDQQMLFHKAQTASLDEIRETEEQIVSAREENLSRLDREYQEQYWRLVYNGASEKELTAAYSEYMGYRNQQSAGYDRSLYTLRDSQLAQGKYGDAYAALEGLAGQVMSGAMSTSDASAAFWNEFRAGGDAGKLSELLSEQINLFGGTNGLLDRISYYDQAGNAEMQSAMQSLYTMSQIATQFSNNMFSAATYADRGGSADRNPVVTPEISVDSFGEIPVTLVPVWEGVDPVMQLEEQGVDVQVEGDTQSIEGTIEDIDGQTLTQYLTGDPTQLQATITTCDGETLTEYVTGNTAALAAAIDRYNGRTVHVNIVGQQLFAEGGRATTASVFGEAGPEWAIPEEHTERTAALLDAARAASGFTWGEIINRFGGMNANASYTPTTLVYSPTINAGDASGVDKVLQDDKDRLQKWFDEQKMRDRLEVYA